MKIFVMAPVLILLLFCVIAVMVLFIKLCSKRPWTAVVAVLGMLLLLAPVLWLILARVVSHRVASVQSSVIRPEDPPAAIWLPGIEDEFKANVYPSKLSAAHSLGLRIDEPVRQVFGDQTWPSKGILFPGGHDRNLLDEFIRTTVRAFPQTTWTIHSETVAVQPDEVGIRLDLVDVQTHPAPWRGRSESRVTGGTIRANVLAAEKQASIKADFVEKPWVEDFSGFLNTEPNRQFIIARSADSCVTEAEANRQALENACTPLIELLGQTSGRPSGRSFPLAPSVNPTDIIEGDFILDRFVQSFEGRAGRIWRQALLIDTSAEKLKQLARRKVIVAKVRKTTWARMFLSIAGLLALITAVYAFLNAATKGYYAWSLRIAGIVLALTAIIFLLA